MIGRTALSRSTVHILDAQTDPDYQLREALKLGDYHTMLGVPLLREGNVVGVFGLARTTVRPFTEKQIELVTTFADQAVIAIENARLLSELRESLQQQTATADVLKVISRSTFDLETVLNTLVEAAARLCGADKAQILRPSEKANSFYSAASYGHSHEYQEYFKTITIAPGRQGVVGRVLLERKPVQIADVLADAEYQFTEAQRLGGFRTHLGLPLLREGNPVGILVLSRVTVRPFDDEHIELLTIFADQAVIAIENTRLLNELRQRTDDLTESLEQQTATSEVLKVISSSPGDLQPVFEAMLANATRICEAKFGNLSLYENGGFRHVALHGAPPGYAQLREREPVVIPHATQGLGRLAKTKQTVHITDILAEPAEARGRLADLAGARTLLIVPMLKEQDLVGSMGIYRQEVRPFSDKQIELVQNFAAQAVIAIENTRLLSELRESLEQQMATSEVLRVISSSPTNVQPVFEFDRRECGEAVWRSIFFRGPV